ncbi:hypothetical protein GFY24_01630 [Nocardia sp. SYP-A9097]|uniref:hypothetical protein n=1 Tax=Nocardia sp. SYP-A9097 TaxID=2663237 RepID=UPI00129BCBB6|nr:hypothetical protein [Nocardia sp. SYP-A9097]MRH86176.1 hypothetical protein [Nocardia sp. SYP-A9097]
MTNEPTTVFDDDVMITMRGIADSIGLPHTVNPVEHVDREALIELRQGPAGDAGPVGDPAWPWDWQGDVADAAALQALNLTTSDARKAWRVVAENAVYYWTGLELVAFANAFGKAGARGKANRLSGSAVAGPTGSAASARIIGTAPNQSLEITFPRGDTGDTGDAGAAGRIQDSDDVLVDNTHQLGQDVVLSWNAALQKFVPIPSPRLGGPWAIGQGQFTGGTGLNEDSKVLATITIPSQSMNWRPLVEGWINIGTEGPRYRSRCNVEIRIGGPDGDLIGFGAGTSCPNFTSVWITPWYQYVATPNSTFGVVPANQTITLYVVARRAFGSERYFVKPNDAQVIVYADPV